MILEAVFGIETEHRVFREHVGLNRDAVLAGGVVAGQEPAHAAAAAAIGLQDHEFGMRGIHRRGDDKVIPAREDRRNEHEGREPGEEQRQLAAAAARDVALDLRDLDLAPFGRRHGIGRGQAGLAHLHGLGKPGLARVGRAAAGVDGYPAALVPARAAVSGGHDKLQHVGALERVDAAGAQLPYRVEIRDRGEPVFLGHPAGHAQLPPGQPLLADRVDIGFGPGFAGRGDGTELSAGLFLGRGADLGFRRVFGRVGRLGQAFGRDRPGRGIGGGRGGRRGGFAGRGAGRTRSGGGCGAVRSGAADAELPSLGFRSHRAVSLLPRCRTCAAAR